MQQKNYVEINWLIKSVNGEGWFNQRYINNIKNWEINPGLREFENAKQYDSLVAIEFDRNFTLPVCSVCYECCPIAMRASCNHPDLLCAICVFNVLSRAYADEISPKCPMCREIFSEYFWEFSTTIYEPSPTMDDFPIEKYQQLFPLLCYYADLRMVKKWREMYGLEVNSPGLAGYFPIHISGSTEVTEYLLENGAEIHITPNFGSGKYLSPLSTHCILGNLQVLKILIHAGASMNRQQLAHAFWNAAAYGHLEIVKFLIQQGADVNSFQEGITPFVICTRVEQGLEVMKFLAENKIVTEQIQFDRALWYSTAFGHIESVKYLINHGANLEFLGINFNTPLHMAVLFKHFMIAKLLVEKGAKLNSCNGNHETPIDISEYNGCFEITAYLKEKQETRDYFVSMLWDIFPKDDF